MESLKSLTCSFEEHKKRRNRFPYFLLPSEGRRIEDEGCP
jgi:hypothetical protein